MVSPILLVASLAVVDAAPTKCKSPSNVGPDPCGQIFNACTKNGFVVGKWRDGYGLYKHCYNPIREGTPRKYLPDMRANMTIPSVDQAVVDACLAEKPIPNCRKLVRTCLDSGFVAGKAGEGYGLYKHCYNPIRRGLSRTLVDGIRADMTIPPVSDDVIQGCLKERPLSNCEKVKVACTKSGFIEGNYEKGNGLWVQCINPIMKKVSQDIVPGLKIGMRIPDVDEKIINACKAENPKFGDGDVGFTGKLLS